MVQKNLQDDFIKLITENENLVFKVCNIYAKNQVEKEDLKQEIIYQLWKSYASFRGEAKIQTWMYKVALNTALYFNKHKQPHTSDLSNVQIEDDQSLMELEDRLKQMYLAIRKLNELDKAITLLYLEKRTYQEIAEIMGITEKNVGVRLVRIKEKLRQLISKEVLS